MRLASLVSLVVLVMLLLCTIPFMGTMTAPGWMFRADEYHTGVYDDGGMHPINTALWVYTTGGTVESSPAVVNGIVYVGSDDGNLYALDAITGAKIWNYPNRWVSDSSPAVANGIVYVEDDYGNMTALNAFTGAKIWSYTSSGAWGNSPVVVNGIVYGGDMGGVYALNANTGTKIWSYATVGSRSSPAVANGVVYVESRDGNVYALDAITGAKIWNYTISAWGYVSPLDTSPTVANGIVYIGGNVGAGVYALDANTGAKIWNSSFSNYMIWSPVVTSPAVANGIIYAGCDDGNMYALDANTGAKIWNYTTGNKMRSSPAVANGIVYVGAWDGNIYALDAITGTKIWGYPTGYYGPSEPGFASSPAVADGVVYVGSGNSVYAIGSAPPLISRYSYVKNHVISGSVDGALSNYQMKFVVHSGSGIDNGQDVYLDGHSLSWPYDIRFYDGSNNPLSYWIESYDSNSATVWVKIGDIPASPSSTTIYMYYGRANDYKPGNGSNTFTFFDDFNDLSQWSTSGATSVSNGIATVSSSSSSYTKLTSTYLFPDYTRIRFKAKTSHSGRVSNTYEQFSSSTSNSNGYEMADYTYSSNTYANKYEWRTNGVSPSAASIAGWSANTYHIQDLIRHGKATWYVDNVNQVDGSTYNYDGSSQYLTFQTAGKNSRMDIDWIFVSNYTSNEPTHGSWGVETHVVMANFHSNITSGLYPLTVQFMDDSIGSIISRQWDFGDGTGNSTEQNPVHTYSSPGKYTVTLTVTNPPGSNTLTKTDYIWVTKSDYDANLTLIYPHGVSNGSAFTYSITAINTGNLPWSNSDNIWLAGTNSDSALFGTTRFDLPANVVVQPGESYTFTLDLIAPNELGTYNPWYQMVHNGNVFGKSNGKMIYVPYVDPVMDNNGTYLSFPRVIIDSGELVMYENDTAYLAAGVDYDHAFIDTTNDTWYIVFRTGSAMKARSNQAWDGIVWGIQKGEPVPCIYKHSLQVDESHNYSFDPFSPPSYGEPWNGAWPWDGGVSATQLMYTEETKTLLFGILGELAGMSEFPCAGFPLTAYDMIYTYYHYDDSDYVKSIEPNMFRWGWIYLDQYGVLSNDTSDASNFMWWKQILPANENDQFTVTSYMTVEYNNVSQPFIPGLYTYTINQPFTITIKAPPPVQNTMNGMQLSQYGIQTITLDEYQNNPDKYKLTKEEKDYLKKDGKLYHIPKDKLDKYVKVTRGKATVTVK